MARNIGTTVTGARRTETPPGGGTYLLHVVFPIDLRQTVSLRSRETAIGRDPGLDGVLVDHATISRRHATLTWNASQQLHAVQDLGSRNGTWVDGVALTTAPRGLISGSLLRLGDTLLVYEEASATTADGEVSLDEIPGESAGVRRLRAQIARAAPDPAPV